MIMGPAILLMAAGYPAGGWLGDKLFKKHKGGRLISGEIGVVLGMIGLFLAMKTPNEQRSALWPFCWAWRPSSCPSPRPTSSPPCMMSPCPKFAPPPNPSKAYLFKINSKEKNQVLSVIRNETLTLED